MITGNSIADVIQKYPRHFKRLDQILIRVGEETGQLSEMFESLSQWYAFRQRTQRVIRTGLILPVVMIHALALIAPIVPFALGGFHVGVYVQTMAGILAMFYIPTLLILGIIVFTPRYGPLRRLWDGFLMAVPLLGKAIRDLDLCRFSRVFSITYQAGIPIVRCVKMAIDAVTNQVMHKQLAGSLEKVKKGDPMSAGWSPSLPAEFINLWEVGEESGQLDDTSRRLAEVYADSAEIKFALIAQWVPRMIYAVVSAVMIYYIFKGFSQIYSQSL